LVNRALLCRIIISYRAVQILARQVGRDTATQTLSLDILIVAHIRLIPSIGGNGRYGDGW